MDQVIPCLKPISGFPQFCTHSKVLAMAQETLHDMVPANLSHFISFPSPPSSHTVQLLAPGLCQPWSYLQGPSSFYMAGSIVFNPFHDLWVHYDQPVIFLSITASSVRLSNFDCLCMYIYFALLVYFLGFSTRTDFPWRQGSCPFPSTLYS